MKVVIAGAAGFLGSHLCDAYLAGGNDVLAIDNLCTSSGENIAHLRGNARFRFLNADLCDALDSIDAADLVLHFASPASPKDYAEMPVATLKVNARGTEACCAAALRWNARFLYASTSEVYGDPLVHPQPETYWGNVNPVGERSCYDEGKRYGEAMIAAYHREHAIDARIVRIFNTYGPRMRGTDGRVVPAFITQALAGAPLTVYGDGKQTRCLCYVDDLIDGIVRFSQLPDPAHRVVNLGSDVEVSVNDIAGVIAKLCGVPLKVRHDPLPSDDPMRRHPDLQRARELLGWRPRTSMEDGMRETIAWFRAAAAPV